jgi:hypothetical protein
VSGLVGPAPKSVQRQLRRGPLRTTTLRAAITAALCTTGFVLAVGVRAPRTDLAVRWYAAALAGCVLATLVRALDVQTRDRDRGAPGFEELAHGDRSRNTGTPAGLVSLELAVRFGSSSAGDYHIRLHPVLADLARRRLADRGVRLDLPAHRARAVAVLGEQAYELVRPDLPPPDERFDPGPSPKALEELTTLLEQLA